MKIIEHSTTTEDYRDFLTIQVFDDEGELTELSFSDSEPEDSSLARSFSDVYKFADLMKSASESKEVDIQRIRYSDPEDYFDAVW